MKIWKEETEQAIQEKHETHDISWNIFISNTGDDIHGGQISNDSIKISEHLNQEERETIRLNMICR